MATTHANPDAGRILAAEALIERLTHLAVGTGDGTVLPSAPATGLQQEIARVRYLQRSFAVVDPDGEITQVPDGPYRLVATPTDRIFFLFRFAADQAVAAWSELGLFGGDVALLTRAAVLADGPQGGDDRAHVDVLLGGSYVGADSQVITVTCTTGGASGAAQIGWTATGSEPGQAGVPVTFGASIPLGITGLTLTFLGGADAALSVGDVWTVAATGASVSPTYAEGGLYDPVANPGGQVLRAGRLFRLFHLDPPFVHGASVLDVQTVVQPLAGGAA